MNLSVTTIEKRIEIYSENQEKKKNPLPEIEKVNNYES